MLSYLYRIATDYRRRHGVAPTLLYLNPRHLARLRAELAGIEGMEGISRFLGMEMLIDRGVQHPHVAWSRIQWRAMPRAADANSPHGETPADLAGHAL